MTAPKALPSPLCGWSRKPVRDAFAVADKPKLRANVADSPSETTSAPDAEAAFTSASTEYSAEESAHSESFSMTMSVGWVTW